MDRLRIWATPRVACQTPSLRLLGVGSPTATTRRVLASMTTCMFTEHREFFDEADTPRSWGGTSVPSTISTVSGCACGPHREHRGRERRGLQQLVHVFGETNVRLYTVDEHDRAGVMFLLMHASRLLNVLGARAVARLPYMRQRMGMHRDRDEITYTCHRRWPHDQDIASRLTVRLNRPPGPVHSNSSSRLPRLLTAALSDDSTRTAEVDVVADGKSVGWHELRFRLRVTVILPTYPAGHPHTPTRSCTAAPAPATTSPTAPASPALARSTSPQQEDVPSAPSTHPRLIWRISRAGHWIFGLTTDYGHSMPP